MDIKDLLSSARKSKEDEAKGEYPFDVLHELQIIRDDLSFIIWPSGLPEWWGDHEYNSKEHLLSITRQACPTLGAQQLLFIADSFMQMGKAGDFDERNEHGDRTTSIYEKLRASRHKGSMMSAWNAGEADIYKISESLVIYIVDKKSDDEVTVQQAMLPYKQKGRRVIWDMSSDLVSEDGKGIEGRLHDIFVESMLKKDFMKEVLETPMGQEIGKDVPPDRQRFHTDIVALQNLVETGRAMVAMGGSNFALMQEYSARLDEFQNVSSSSVIRPNREERRARQKKK